jgi:hypothetical protein
MTVANSQSNSLKTRKFSFVSEAILLALASLAAYFYTFIYNVGFNSVFAIPNEFVEIQLGTAFIALISVFSVLVMGVILANSFIMVWPERWVLRIKILRVLLVAIPFLWKFFLFGGQFWGEWWRSRFLLYVAAIIAITEFVLPIFQFRGKSTYIEKLEADEAAEDVPRSRSLFGILQARIGTHRYLLILALIFGAWLAHDIGRSVALKKKNYLVLQAPQEVVVLRISGNLLICAPFDRCSKEVEKHLIIKQLTDKSELVLKTERIGPLKVAVEK